MTTVIKGGTVVTADLTCKAEVVIEGGKIIEIGADIHGEVPLRRRAVAQRGRGVLQGVAAAGVDVLLHAALETAEIVD